MWSTAIKLFERIFLCRLGTSGQAPKYRDSRLLSCSQERRRLRRTEERKEQSFWSCERLDFSFFCLRCCCLLYVSIMQISAMRSMAHEPNSDFFLINRPIRESRFLQENHHACGKLALFLLPIRLR